MEKVRCEKLGIGRYSRMEILHIRHHSLFAPCDFDLSPYFQIIKPTLENGFNYKGLQLVRGGRWRRLCTGNGDEAAADAETHALGRRS